MDYNGNEILHSRLIRIIERAGIVALVSEYPPCSICKKLPSRNDFRNELERKENNNSGKCGTCQRHIKKLTNRRTINHE